MENRAAAQQIARQRQQVWHREMQCGSSGVIRASAIAQCGRRIGYGLLGYQAAPESAQGLFTLDVGSALHTLVQRQLVALGWVKARPALAPDGSLIWEQDGDPLSGCELSLLDTQNRLSGHPDAITVPLKRYCGAPDDVEFAPGAGAIVGGYYPHPDGERYLVEIKSVSDRPRFWVRGIRDGGSKAIHETADNCEFITPDIEETRSGGRQQRLMRFSHLREVISEGYAPQLKPVYRVRINGADELVTVIMTGNSQGQFSAMTAPRPDHIEQATCYAAHYGLAKILFVYVGKETDFAAFAGQGGRTSDNSASNDLLHAPLKIYEHTVQEHDIRAAHHKIAAIYAHTDRGELPPRDYDWSDRRSECRRCPFAWQCWPDRVDAAPIQRKLAAIGLPPLTPGPTREATAPLPTLVPAPARKRKAA